AKSIKEHEEKQEKLLEGFIHLIANMIDRKSPYTGEHCKKVPILTQMILNEVNASEEGSFKEFHIKDKELLKGIEWSSWLHDCGKLIIPNDIIDKATKLEIVYNRIHEIRTRFEVVLRDAKIAYYKARMDGVSHEIAQAEYERKKAQLQSDFAFIAQLNLGETEVSEDDCKRLHKISSVTWERNFSKYIGISWQERERLGKSQKEETLPVLEKLLQDGKEHEITRSQSDLTLYKEEKVKMEIPELLYNKGEIYNLCIPIGTITKEEKFKIQEHAIHTLKILKELPWSDKLKYIVLDAANHHEHLDGTGYPRLLHEDKLSVPARIMAVADIFEALTSIDRPYKKAKPLSEVLALMVDMVKANSIDKEIFKLFIKNKIYLKYAQGYLNEEQIDLENIDEHKIIEALE
ncbi:MAG: HD domain-containing protein, partial [Epsilonproteobacteria bacterium]|nr:HD domain-containing protein [Campylobacterota bacterium]